MKRLILAAVLLTAMSGTWAAEDIPMIDAHSQVAPGIDMEKVLSLMNEAGVSRTVLSEHGRSTQDVVAAARRHPGRITASINMKIPPRLLIENVAKAVRRIQRAGRKPLFGAISEAMLCHEKKGRKAPEILRPFDAPEIRAALAVALQRHWPFVIHIEFGYARSIGRYDYYMRGLEHLLALHPDHPVALTHMGQLGADEVRRLIEAYPNIYFLTSHANPIFSDRSRANLPWTNLFDGDALAPQWRDLVLRHPDRFVLAFDNVYLEDWGDFYLRQARLWKAALAKLPAGAANAVAHRNAERLWNLPALAPTGVSTE